MQLLFWGLITILTLQGRSFSPNCTKLHLFAMLSNIIPQVHCKLLAGAAETQHARMSSHRAPNLKGALVTAVVGTPLTDEWTEAYIEIWKILANNLNFTLKVRVLDARLPESSWTRLLAEVQTNGIHVSLAPIVMLPSTSLNITFSTPVHPTTLSVIVRGGAKDRVRWNSFLQPFNNSLWFAMLSSVSLLSLVLTILWRTETSIILRGSSHPSIPVSEAVLCVFGAACSQGHASPPQSTGARWLHLTALISAVIIVSVYSSSVTAFLAVTREDKPFSTLTQLLVNTRYRPFTLAGSPENTIIQDSLYPALVNFRSKHAPSELPSLSTALMVTCGHNNSLLGRWSGRVPALVIPTLWASRVLAAAPCQLTHYVLSDSAEQKLWAAFPMSTKLSHTRLINEGILRLHEAGAIVRWHVQIQRRASHALEEETVDASRFSVSFRDITPLLAMLGCGAALACILVILEKLIYVIIRPVQRKHPFPFHM